MISISGLLDNIISDIVSLLDQNSITNFCLTCSKFNKIGNSQLKKRIVIVPKTTNNVILDNYELLQTFTYGFTKVEEDSFTELYSREFFKNTKELACLEVYKVKKLQDYKTKLPQLENFFTFDSKSYDWYEDFIQYRWTADVNIARQYQNRTMQRTIIPEGKPSRFRRRNLKTINHVEGNENESEVSETEISESEIEEGSLLEIYKEQEHTTRKLYTKMNQRLKYFNFSKYSKFKKLKYLYLSNTESIDKIRRIGFKLKLTTVLCLSRFGHSRDSYVEAADMYMLWGIRDNEIHFIHHFPEYPEVRYTKPRIIENELFKLPINWKHLKELRFSLEELGSDYSIFATKFKSLEVLYIHHASNCYRDQVFDFILNLKRHILRQVIIFSRNCNEDQVGRNVKELENILRKQRRLVRFTIRYGQNSSFEVKELLNTKYASKLRNKRKKVW